MGKKIKWLHIADLHLNQNGAETVRMRRKLIEYLRYNNITCEYVFCVGDLRSAPLGGFANDTVPYLQEICQAVGTPVNNLFLVPGNHDIYRDCPERMDSIERLYMKSRAGYKGYYNPSEGIIYTEDLINISKGKEDFENLITQLYQSIPERINLYTNKLNPHFIVETENLNILHLDSTLVYMAEQENNLIIGTNILLRSLENLNKNKITILLTHYSYDFLNRDEQNQIFTMLLDSNIKLWLAGHEHTSLVRQQRDLFYECQCGNLLIENKSRSCVLIGELDLDNKTGTITAHAWNSPDGWSKYSYINPVGNKKDIYDFDLSSSENKKNTVKDIAKLQNLRDIGDGFYLFNLNSLNREMLEYATDSDFEYIKYQLGDRITGNETRDEILSFFYSEVKMSLNSNKRINAMPLFQDVIREIHDAFIILDNQFAPIAKVKVYLFYWENVDRYMIVGDGYKLYITRIGEQIIQFSFGYHLSNISDVDERLLKFQAIKKISSASSLLIKIPENIEYNVSVDLKKFSNISDINEKIKLLDFWIEQMTKISEIENYFGVKFVLPQKASDEDYMAIDIINDSIHRECCSTLPPLKMEETDDKDPIIFDNEVDLGEPKNLSNLNLFGFTFIPVKRYIIPCKLIWRENAWQTKDGGVPTCIEFKLDKTQNIDKI